jgi:acetyl-CoA carboxylase carboxyltransferase component
VAKRAELEEQFASLQSPFRQAEAFAVHDIIHPSETRSRLIDWLAIISPKLSSDLGPPRFSYRP